MTRRWLRAQGLAPDRILCRAARRARQTWQPAQAGPGAAPLVAVEPGLYDGAAPELPALTRRSPPAVGTLLVIGHNPAIEDLISHRAANYGTVWAGRLPLPAAAGGSRPGPRPG